MRKLLSALPLTVFALLLPGCETVSTFDKYATLRFFEMDRTEIKYSYFDEELGIRSKPHFRDKMLPMRIADNDQWIDFTDDLGSNFITLGNRIQRETFPAGLEPVFLFVAWSELPSMQRLLKLDVLNTKPELTSINARLVLEHGTDEPLLVFTGNSLPLTKVPAYALDRHNARMLLGTAQMWFKNSK
jgi:hypothetical protein